MVSCTRGCGFQECSRQVCSLHPYPAYSPWSYFPWRGEFLVSPPQTWVDLSDCLTSSVQQKWCHVILSKPGPQRSRRQHISIPVPWGHHTMRKPHSPCENTIARCPHQGREQCQATTQPSPSGILFFFFLMFIYLATPGLMAACGIFALFLWHVGSLVLAWEFLVAV